MTRSSTVFRSLIRTSCAASAQMPPDQGGKSTRPITTGHGSLDTAGGAELLDFSCTGRGARYTDAKMVSPGDFTIWSEMPGAGHLRFQGNRMAR